MSTTVWTKDGPLTFTKSHAPWDCAGRACILHNPIRPTEDRRLVWRATKGVFEEVCEHGVGHTTDEDMIYLRTVGQEYRGIHGCDGCIHNDER